MSTHNIQFYDKIRKFLLIFVFLCYRKNSVGTQKRVRISHDKRAIGVRAIEVRLYTGSSEQFLFASTPNALRIIINGICRIFDVTLMYRTADDRPVVQQICPKYFALYNEVLSPNV